MAFDSPQEATVISLPFAHWMGMCSSASGILLASSSNEYCPGIWPVSQDSSSACHSTDPPGWTRGKNERLLAEREPTASKVGTMPFCSTFFSKYLSAPDAVWVSGEDEGRQIGLKNGSYPWGNWWEKQTCKRERWMKLLFLLLYFYKLPNTHLSSLCMI